MSETELKQSDRDLIYLLSCALNSADPSDEKVGFMDLRELYKAARAHSLGALIYMTLEHTEALSHDPQLLKRWKEDKDKAIRKNMLLDAEREKILSFMEENGIWYMPLKGSILKTYYPRFGMRQMADNDILFDRAFQMRMCEYMKAQGYEAVSVGKGVHDVYKKPPIYNFELHTALFGSSVDQDWEDYYRDVKEILIKDEGKQFGYHFKDEDFYVYITAHTCKHFRNSGTGLRSLTDTFCYLVKMKDRLNWDYVVSQLQKLGIAELEERMRSVAEKLFHEVQPFDEALLNEDEKEMLLFLCGCGTYGTEQSRVQNRLREIQSGNERITEKTKLKYYVGRLFPNLEWYRRNKPFCYQHRWAIPFFCCYRIGRSVLLRNKRLRAEIQAVKSIK